MAVHVCSASTQEEQEASKAICSSTANWRPIWEAGDLVSKQKQMKVGGDKPTAP